MCIQYMNHNATRRDATRRDAAQRNYGRVGFGIRHQTSRARRGHDGTLTVYLSEAEARTVTHAECDGNTNVERFHAIFCDTC